MDYTPKELAELNQEELKRARATPLSRNRKILHMVEGTDEPIFIFRAKDLLSTLVLKRYQELVDDYQGDDHEHGEAIAQKITEFVAWQRANPDRVKLPD